MLLESIEETTSEYTSSNSLKDKIKAVKKCGEQVQNALIEVQKYKCICAYQECKTPNRKVKVLCGRLKARWRKIPFCRINETNRSVLKQSELAKIETGNRSAELCEQIREAKEKSSKTSQIDVVEVSDDDASEEETATKPQFMPQGKLKDTADKDNATGSRSKDVNSKINSTLQTKKKSNQCLEDGNPKVHGSVVKKPNSKENIRPNGVSTVIDSHRKNDSLPRGAKHMM